MKAANEDFKKSKENALYKKNRKASLMGSISNKLQLPSGKWLEVPDPLKGGDWEVSQRSPIPVDLH